jgi:hypothetical protein
MKELIDALRAARSVSTPLIAITTPDQPAVVRALRDPKTGVNGESPIVTWNRASGFAAENEKAQKVLAELASKLHLDSGPGHGNEGGAGTSEAYDPHCSVDGSFPS